MYSISSLLLSRPIGDNTLTNLRQTATFQTIILNRNFHKSNCQIRFLNRFRYAKESIITDKYFHSL